MRAPSVVIARQPASSSVELIHYSASTKQSFASVPKNDMVGADLVRSPRWQNRYGVFLSPPGMSIPFGQNNVREYYDWHTRFSRRARERAARVEPSGVLSRRIAEFGLYPGNPRPLAYRANRFDANKSSATAFAARTMPSCGGMSAPIGARAVPGPLCQ